MQTNQSSINLISTKTGLSPEVELIENSVRRASTISIFVFLAAGFLIGGLYLYFSSQLTSLEAMRTELRSQINSAKKNEGLLVSIKDRTRIVERAMASQRPWAETLDLLGTVAVPPALASVSVGEQNKIEITIQDGSIEAMRAPIATLISYANEGKIRNPVLQSVQFDKTGVVIVAVSFTMVF